MLIGLSGKAQSGKDTVAKIIQWLSRSKDFEFLTFDQYTNTPNIPNVSSWQTKRFADKLKDIVCLLIGCTREQLEDPTFKEQELGEEWEQYYLRHKGGQGLITNLMTKTEAEQKSLFAEYELHKIVVTPRILLQSIGTDLFRKQLNENVWINATMKDYKATHAIDKCPFMREDYHAKDCLPHWIIPDVRFPNEVKAIKDKGGIVIRINRYTGNVLIDNDTHTITDWQHPSETALDDYKNFDYLINNDGTLEQLISNVKNIFNEITCMDK